jgi:hypothetical protein
VHQLALVRRRLARGVLEVFAGDEALPAQGELKKFQVIDSLSANLSM